jgi:hypothetical protein
VPVDLFHLGHVPDQAEQRHRRRLARTGDELLSGQAFALGQQGRPVVLKPAVQQPALVTKPLWHGPLGHREFLIAFMLTICRGMRQAIARFRPAVESGDPGYAGWPFTRQPDRHSNQLRNGPTTTTTLPTKSANGPY